MQWKHCDIITGDSSIFVQTGASLEIEDCRFYHKIQYDHDVEHEPPIALDVSSYASKLSIRNSTFYDFEECVHLERGNSDEDNIQNVVSVELVDNVFRKCQGSEVDYPVCETLREGQAPIVWGSSHLTMNGNSNHPEALTTYGHPNMAINLL